MINIKLVRIELILFWGIFFGRNKNHSNFRKVKMEGQFHGFSTTTVLKNFFFNKLIF